MITAVSGAAKITPMLLEMPLMTTPALVRAFCRQASSKIKRVNYVLVHHTSGVYENFVREMDTLLNLTHTGFASVRCKTGKIKTIKCTENDTVCFPKTSP